MVRLVEEQSSATAKLASPKVLGVKNWRHELPPERLPAELGLIDHVQVQLFDDAKWGLVMARGSLVAKVEKLMLELASSNSVLVS